MRSERISNSASVYIFDDIEDYATNVFLIEKETKFYLIDTYCGTDSMKPIINTIKNTPRQKEVKVINTHFHWDHIWAIAVLKITVSSAMKSAGPSSISIGKNRSRRVSNILPAPPKSSCLISLLRNVFSFTMTTSSSFTAPVIRWTVFPYLTTRRKFYMWEITWKNLLSMLNITISLPISIL